MRIKVSSENAEHLYLCIVARYFVQLSYSGKKFNGWQIQDNTPNTVQEILEKQFSGLLREKISITGCGRTDAGVHASNFFAHFDTQQMEFIENPDKWIYKLNKVLPAEIALRKFFRVEDTAHCRYDAISRTYEYRIHDIKNPFLNDWSFYFPFHLDTNKMNEACEILCSYADFNSFSKSNTQVKTTICKIEKAIWERNNTQLIFTITADRFLRNMVRAIVGTLLEIGENKMSLEEFIHIIESKDRKKAGVSAPAQGLCLTRVIYPKGTIQYEI